MAESLEALGLSKETLEGADFGDIPEHLGESFPDPPQPGVYRFKLPTAQQMAAIWDKIATDKYGERLVALFADDAALTIVQSPGSSHNGESYRWRLSNVPRPRTKEQILVSDWDLFLRGMKVPGRPTTNLAYAKALLAFAGREFTATNEFSYRCSPDRDIYVDDGQGGTSQVEGRKGCGQRYYQRDVQKVLSDPADPNSARVYPVRITCGNPECGASIRAFPNLTGFKP